MKQLTTTLFAAAAMTLVAQAGPSSPVMSSGKGKQVMPPPPAGCPCNIAYNYVQAFYGHGEFSNSEVSSSDGVNFQASYSPVEHFFLTAGGGWDHVNASFGDFNDYTLHAGAGAWIPLAPCIHLGVEAGAAYDATTGGVENFGDGDFSFYGKPHVRFCSGVVEGKVGVQFTTADVDTVWMIQTELILKVLGPADLAVGFDWNDDVQYYNAGIRFRF